MERFIKKDLQNITEDGWAQILQTIDNSGKHVYGVTPEYVEATKKFAREIYRFVQNQPVSNDWLERFRTTEEFSEEYIRTLRKTLDRFLRETDDNDTKRTIICLINHFMDRTRYFPIFPVVEERIDKAILQDAGDYYVRLSVVLPNGKRIPIKQNP